MPPKPKFTREQIIAAALEIASKKGIEMLTARELYTALGTSASPIFTLFDSMAEIQAEVRNAAMQRFESFAEASFPDMPLFKRVGLKMVLFGLQEPKLYQLLFMQENSSAISFDDVFGELGATATMCIEAIQRDYALSAAQAKLLFENVWIYTFGVGALCATKVCHFSQERLSQMLSTQFHAMMLLVQSGDNGK